MAFPLVSLFLCPRVIFALPWQDSNAPAQAPAPPKDAVQDAQTTKSVTAERPEQRLTEHDKSKIFRRSAAPHNSPLLNSQSKAGEMRGFDFSRDPLNADLPGRTAAEIRDQELAANKEVMAKQADYLAKRFDLTPRLDPEVRMSRGKPVSVGPTVRLPKGVTFDSLASMTASEIREKKLFPYPSLPHPLHTNGGQVFPAMQLEMFPRLQRFDVDFDLPEAFLPEFPPAIFLQNRPELGDVSRGQVVSINNFHELFGIYSRQFS
jgi:hypothetical protein